MDKPRWLDDETEITALLHRFLDKLDKKPASQWKQAPEIKLSGADFPTLARQDDDADRQWLLIQQLAGMGIFELRAPRKRNFYDPDHLNARLLLQPGAEQILRQWLQRPSETPLAQLWRAAVNVHADAFPAAVEILKSRPARIAGKSADEVVMAFAAIGAYQTQPLSLRQLSARCFWGDSKFLDSREELITTLFPGLTLEARPVIINVALPELIEGVLLIENQESYTSLIDRRPALVERLALVYCAGFRAGAQRIRETQGVSFHYRGSERQRRMFEAFWFGESGAGLPLYFWGDLDYSGMAILKALRLRFNTIEAWRPGYVALLTELQQGAGHTPQQGGKEEQADPGESGCSYADDVLLPALRRMQRFVDQEFVVF